MDPACFGGEERDSDAVLVVVVFGFGYQVDCSVSVVIGGGVRYFGRQGVDGWFAHHERVDGTCG